MMRRAESKFLRHLVLEIFDVRRKEFDHLTALGADHMIVMLVIVMMLVIGLVIAESHFAREPSLGEKLERPVYGRVADGRILFLHQPVKIVARQMIFRAKKDLHYQIALPGSPEAGFLDMLQKDLLFLRELLFLFNHYNDLTVPI